jgi:HK97 family phage portal protein
VRLIEGLARWIVRKGSTPAPRSVRTYAIHDPLRDPHWLRPSQRVGLETLDPYQASVWCYRAIRILADNAAGVPIRLFTGPEDEPTEVTTGPWADLFRRPNPELSSRDLTRWTVTLKNLDGACFWILRGRGDRLTPGEIPSEIWPAQASLFRPLQSPTSGLVEGWEFHSARGTTEVLEPHEVVCHRYMNPQNPLGWQSPLEAAAIALSGDAAAGRWNNALLRNNGAISGLISPKDPDVEWTDDQVDRQRERWRKQHEGAENAGKVAFMSGGAHFQALAMSPKDMEWLAMREWSRQEIATVYGLTLFMLGIVSDVHRETSREARRLFWGETERPLLDEIESVIDGQLLWGRGAGREMSLIGAPSRAETAVRAVYDTSEIPELQMEESERRANAVVDRQLGFPLNEVNRRWHLGYEDQPSGDEGLVSAGLVPVSVAHAEMDLEPVSVPYGETETGAAKPEPEEPQGTQAVEVTQEAVLNGAQIQAALSIVQAVADELIPRDSGIGQLIVLFNLTPEQAEEIMGSTGTPSFTSKKPAPPPAFGVKPPALEDDDDEPEGDEDDEEEPDRSALGPWRNMPGVTLEAVEGYVVERASGGLMLWTRRRRSEDREKRWQHRVRAVYAPGERKILRITRSFLNARLREVLGALGRFSRKDVDAASVLAWLKEQEGRWAKMLSGSTRAVTGEIVERAIKSLDVGFVSMESPAVLAFLEQAPARYETISGHQTARVRDTIARTVATKGSDLTAVREAVVHRYQVDHVKAATIARTETLVATQTPVYRTAVDEGVPRGEWITAGDEEVRVEPPHDIDGEVRAVGEPFTNGLLHPGDPAGSAANICNCRCDWAPVED